MPNRASPDTQPLDLHEKLASAVHEGHRRAASDEAVQKPLWESAVRHGGRTILDIIKRWFGGLIIAGLVTAGGGWLILLAAKAQKWL